MKILSKSDFFLILRFSTKIDDFFTSRILKIFMKILILEIFKKLTYRQIDKFR